MADTLARAELALALALRVNANPHRAENDKRDLIFSRHRKKQSMKMFDCPLKTVACFQRRQEGGEKYDDVEQLARC